MKPTDKTLLEQMKIHDAEIHQRKNLIYFREEDAERLLNCQIFIKEQVDEITEIFYEKQTSFEDIALIIGDADTLQRLIIAQKNYIISLFSGQYDLGYVNNRLRIGLVHKRIGVDPKYYLSALKTLKDILFDIIRKEIDDDDHKEATINSLDKLLCFDTELVFDTYIKSLFTAIEAAKNKSDNYALILEEKVAERTRKLKEISNIDGLTGLFNHRAFIEFLKRDLAHSKRNNTPFSLVYFDVDKFKTVNDTFGHLQGDEILRAIGISLKETVREVDIPCRYGGDEFCVILAGSTSINATIFCERLIESFSDKHSNISLSIGVSETGPDDYVDYELLIKRADTAMYEAKQHEGFKIVISEE